MVRPIDVFRSCSVLAASRVLNLNKTLLFVNSTLIDLNEERRSVCYKLSGLKKKNNQNTWGIWQKCSLILKLSVDAFWVSVVPNCIMGLLSQFSFAVEQETGSKVLLQKTVPYSDSAVDLIHNSRHLCTP